MKIKQLLCVMALFCFIFSSHSVYANTEDLQSEVYQVRFMLCAPDGQIIENKQVTTNSQPLMVQSSSIATEPPILLSASYWLNDEEKSWEQIAGQKGLLRVELVLVNQDKDENSKENIPYFAQIQVAFDLRTSDLLEAPMADRVTIGYIQTLSFSGLLHSTMLATWTAYSDSWTQEPVNITLIPKVIDIPLPDIAAQLAMQLHGLNSMNQGVDEMLEGMQLMEKSTLKLNKGFMDYQLGFRQWSMGFQEFNRNLPLMIKAYEEYLMNMSTMKNGVDQIQTALSEAEFNFKKLRKEIDQAQQTILLLGMTLNQWTYDHDQSLEHASEIIKQNLSIKALAIEIQAQYPKDSSPWNLADKVLVQAQSQEDLIALIQGQSKRVALINSFVLEMQKKMKEEYLPLLEESHLSYKELILGIDQLDDGIDRLIEGLTQGKLGAVNLVQGGQKLSEGLKPLREARLLLADGIKELTQAPRKIIMALRLLRFQGILPMSRASKEAQENFIREKNRQNMQKNIAELHRDQAVIIKIDYTLNAIQNEKADLSIQHAPKSNNPTPLDRFKDWLRSLF
jgi:hypothetical protein